MSFPGLLRKLALLACLVLGACEKNPGLQLRTEVYVWQRPDRAEVAQAMAASADLFSAFHIRAAELKWTASGFEVERTLAELPNARCGLVVRIGASAAQLEWNGEQIAVVAEIFRKLALLKPLEIQCDYDCPQSRLKNYAKLLTALQSAAGEVAVVPTVLPSWLDEADFRTLIAAPVVGNGYVLQVHSLVLPKTPGEPPVIFDPQATRRYVEKAAALGKPFRIAMATYGCELRYGADGKMLAVISEDLETQTPGTTIRSFALADPVASAGLVRGWQAAPPHGLRGIIWYRLPIASDRRNWPFITLQKVARGEISVEPVKIEVTAGSNARDISLVNSGSFPLRLPNSFKIEAAIKAADSAGPYRMEREPGASIYFLRNDVWPWLDPGKKVVCGWVVTETETIVSEIQQ